MFSNIISNISSSQGFVSLITLVLFLIAIFYSLKVVRSTTSVYKRAHVYIFIALLFALFTVSSKICGLQPIGNVPAADVGNIFSAFFFVLGFLLYVKNIKYLMDNKKDSAKVEIGYINKANNIKQ